MHCNVYHRKVENDEKQPYTNINIALKRRPKTKSRGPNG